MEKVRGPLPLQPPSVSCTEGFVSPPFRVNPPWDLLRGKDVFESTPELEDDVLNSDLTHWGPNCATYSRAREIPIHNVKNPPRPLRSLLHPKGIPCEVAKMTRKQKRRLDDDTRMADMAAEMSLERARAGKWFSLEHPAGSIASSLQIGRNSVTSLRYIDAFTAPVCMRVLEGERCKLCLLTLKGLKLS